jgi:hypothetical protein
MTPPQYSKLENRSTLQRGLWLAAILASVLLFAGCIHFVSHYDSVSYEHLTSLKAFHLKFVDDLTDGPNKVWNQSTFERKRDEGDLKFREALEYEKGKSKRDKNREDAFTILYEEFTDNCALLEDKQGFYSQAFAEELKGELETNYDLAIRGEEVRPSD